MRWMWLPLLLLTSLVHAKETWVVPYPPGGPSDVYARNLSQILNQNTGSSILVENVGGAGGAIGVQQALSRNTPLIGSPSETVVAPLQGNTKYKTSDLKLAGLIGRSTLVYVTGSTSRFKDFEGFEREGRTLSHLGVGSFYHLVNLELERRLQKKIQHVPYKGVAQILPDLLNGSLDAALLPLATPVTDYIKQGKLVVLGTTGQHAFSERLRVLPNETKFKDFEFYTWIGLFVPQSYDTKKTASLFADVNMGVRSPAFQKLAQATGVSVLDLSFSQSLEFYTSEVVKYQALTKRFKSQVNGK
jgi:tripartite-type tricarboxylate transporter receptor subunit TctC